MMTPEKMGAYLTAYLLEQGVDDGVRACTEKGAGRLALTSAAFGGGGQEGEKLLRELTLMGAFIKLAAIHGKEVLVLPQEEPKRAGGAA